MDAKETAALVRRTLNGDAEAFAMLYRATSKRICFLCTGFLKNRQDAEDAMQEVYLTAYRNLHQLEEPEKFRRWLEQIAANHCRNQLKRNIPIPVDEEMLSQVEETELVLPEDYVLSREKRHIIMGILQEELSELQYQTVLLYYFNQLSISETAALMGCSENAVKNRLSVARAKIREGVERYEETHQDKLHGFAAVPFLTVLLSEEAKATAAPALERVIPGGIVKLSAIGNSVKAISAAERMGRNMLKTKILIGAGAVIIAAGSAGTILHLQKNMPDNLDREDSRSSIAEVIPAGTETASETEETAGTVPASETIAAEPQTENTPDRTDTVTLYDKGLELIALMDEECRNENWLRLYSSSSLLESEAFARIQAGDYSVPQKVYKVTVSEENMDLLLMMMDANIDMNTLSEPLGNYFCSRLIKSWITVLNSRMGVDYVAAGSIVTAEKAFVCPEIGEDCFYIYTFENACPVAVFYTVGDGGAVTASGQVILAEPFLTGSAEEVAQSLCMSEYALGLFAVEEIG